jgi:VCBS repeat-containing protein
MTQRTGRKSGSSVGGTKPKPNRFSDGLMELEQRIAFDAAVEATLERAVDERDSSGAEHGDVAEFTALASALESTERGKAADEPSPPDDATRVDTQVVFVDSTVKDYDKLLADIKGDFEVVVLDAGTDGVKQMTRVLAEMDNVTSVQIISHGSQGKLMLGSAVLDADSMNGRYRDDLMSLRSVLDADADIMVYGCDFAEGADGKSAAKLLSELTQADVAASDDKTGSAALGGDWDFEYRTGAIESGLALSERGQADYDHLLNAAVSTGTGAMIVSANKGIYSVDIATGKATLVTTVPASITGVVQGSSTQVTIPIGTIINSLAVDQQNGLIYYTDNAGSTTNRALFAYDFANNQHILIDDNVSVGAGAIVTGSSGVGSGGATFNRVGTNNGDLYLGIESATATEDAIYKITMAADGRSIVSSSRFNTAAISATNDWGDMVIDTGTSSAATDDVLLSFSGTTITRYNASGGAQDGQIIGTPVTNGSSGNTQGGGDFGNSTYAVGNGIQRINPVTGATIGSAVTITTNGTTALAGVSDATTWTPQTGQIGDKVYSDKNNNGIQDAGEGGLANVTVQLIDDVNNNGIVDAGERVLATDTTNASGNYLFTGVLPGNYLVRVTDTNGVLGGASPSAGSAGGIKDADVTTIGGSNLAADIGYLLAAPIVDLNGDPALPVTVSGGGTISLSGTGSGGAGTNPPVSGDLTRSLTFTLPTEPAADTARATLNLMGIDDSFRLRVNGVSLATIFSVDVSNGTASSLRFVDGTFVQEGWVANTNGLPRVQVVVTEAGVQFFGTRTSGSTALEALTFNGTLTLPNFVAGNNTIVFSLPDTAGPDSAGGTLAVSVQDFNAAASYAENGTPVSIADTDASVTDNDSANMRSATIVLTNEQAGDRLRIGGAAGTILGNGSTGTINGLTYTVVDTGSSITVTLNGSATKAVYADTIESIFFESTSDAPSTMPRTVNVTVNDGTQDSNTAVTTISVSQVNDAPVNTIGAQTMAEDGSLSLTGLSVSDVDGGTLPITVTLSVPTGAGTLTALAGGGVSVSGSGGNSIALTGTLPNINAYLASAATQPVFRQAVADFNGTIVLTMSINDGGNTGSGGPLTDVDTANITITPVADIANDTATTNEDTAVTISPLLNDNFENTAPQITAVNGLAITAGGAAVAVSNGFVTLNASNQLIFTPAANYDGAASFTYTVTSGGVAETATVAVTVNPVNDPAVLDLDGPGGGTGFSTNYTEDGAGVAIADVDRSITDIDSTNMTSAVLVIGNGVAGDVLAAAGLPAGITASYNAATFTLTLSGSATIADYQAALSAVRFSSTSDNPGATTRSINVTVNDGVANSNTAVATVAVAPVNDAPVNTLPASYTTNEDTAIRLTGLQIADPDENGGSMTIALSVGSGVLTAVNGAGVAVSGSGGPLITLTGTLAALNSYLASAAAPTYTPVADANGPVALTMLTNDNGNTGSGGNLIDSDTSTINVTPVNDAPTLDLDASGIPGTTGFSNTYTEGSAGAAIADTDSVIADIDSASLSRMTIVVTNGQAGGLLSILGTLPAGITASYDAATYTLTLSGTAARASYETALEQVRYSSSSDAPPGTPRLINVTAFDDSGAASNTAVATINIIAVNDAPVNTVPSAYSVAEDGTLGLTGLSVVDPDAGNGTITVTLSVPPGSGLLTAANSGNVTVAGSGTNSIVLSGALADINAYLAGATSRPTFQQATADFNGSVTLTMVTNDGGNTGTGGALSDTDSITITINGVADITNDTASTAEDTPVTIDVNANDSFENNGHTITAINGTAIAAGGGAVSVANGSVTLTASGQLVFAPAADFSGTASFTYTVTSGGVTETATVSVTVTSVNDAPINTLPGGWATDEDVPVALTGLSVTDVDAGVGAITVTLAVGAGTITATSGDGVTVGNTGTSSITLTGTLASINAYLASGAAPVYRPAADANGTVVLTMSSNDNGNMGGGGAKSDVDTRNITIAPVNDAPVNTLPTGYTVAEGTPLVVSGLSITDIDAATGPVSVTLSVNSGTLAAASAAGVTVSDSGTSSITLTGTVSAINAYLASASAPVFTAPTNFNGAVTLTMLTDDGGNTGSGGNLTDSDTRTITVTPVNDAPTLDLDASGTGTGYATSYTENDPGVAIADIDSAIVDIDSPTLTSARVVIANGSAGDVLAIAGTLPAGITASFNPATYTLTLTGNASVAAYETALEQVRYSSTSDNPSTTPRTINVTVNDGQLNSNTAVTTVNVVAVNDAPVNAVPGSQTVNEDGVLVFSVANGNALSVADADNTALTVTLTTANGTFSLSGVAGLTFAAGDGTGDTTMTFTGTASAINAALAGSSYRPTADYNGPSQQIVISTDAGNLGDSDAVAITISAVADIADDTATTNEDTPIVINVNANDSFENSVHVIIAINGRSIAVGGVVAVTNGSVELNSDGTLTFTPAANYNGPASFTYTVTSGGVTETATVRVTVNAINDTPVNTVPGAQTTAEDSPLAITGVQVDDVDGGTITTTVQVVRGTVTVTTGGGASISGNATSTITISGTTAQVNAALAGLTYRNTPDYHGPAQISLTTSDGTLSSTNVIAITVGAVADIVNDTVTVAEDGVASFNVISGTTGADSFEGTPAVTAINGLAFTPGTSIAIPGGSIVVAANGQVTFTPNANFNGPTSFTYTVTSGGVTETATVSINVTPVNDLPVSTNSSVSTAEDTTLSGQINATDADDDALTYQVVGQPAHGSVTINADGTYSYVPAADYNGPDSFRYVVRDGTGSSVVYTVSINVTAVADIANDTVSTDEDVPVVISVLGNDAFDNADREITAINGQAIASGGGAVTVTNGSVQLNAQGQLIFTPALDFNGNSSFTYTVTSGGVTETATVNVAVASINKPPINTLPSTYTTLEDRSVPLTGLRVADTDAGNGIVTIELDVDSGTLTAASAAGVTVSGSGSGTLTLSGTIAALNSYLANGTRPVFAPAAHATGSVMLTMTSNDNGNTGGPALSDIDTATISITPVNDAPAGTNKTVTIDEDTAHVFATSDFGFTDPLDNPDNAFTAVIITTLPTGGVLTLGGSAVRAGQQIAAADIDQLVFTPAANANGVAYGSFTFQVVDNGGTANGGVNTDASPNTFTVNVTPVNDAPINTLPESIAGTEDRPLRLTGLSVRDIDAGSAPITVQLSVETGVLTAANGPGVTVSGSNTGTIVLTGTVASINAYLLGSSQPTFIAPANFNGTVDLTMVSNDRGNTGTGGALSDTDTTTITIGADNDAPVAAPDAISTNEDTPFNGTLPAASDVDGDTLTYGAGATSPRNGTVTINPNGTYTYTPDANFNGDDTFTYTISDGTATVEYTVTVTVNPVNDAPIADADRAATDQNTPTTINVLANDSDVDGGPLRIVGINGNAEDVAVPVNGSNGGTFVVGTNGATTFDPGDDFDYLAKGQTATTSITYRVSDGRGGFATAVFTVTVTGLDDAPVAGSLGSQSGNDAQPVAGINVSGAFSDADRGDTLTFSATNLPPGLSINPATGVISGTISRDASQSSPYAVVVTATDRDGESASAGFTWTIANPPPVAANDAGATTENATTSGNVLTNDRDGDGDPLTVSAVSGGIVGDAVEGSNGGTFTINPDGTYAFSPGSSFDNLAPGATRTTSVTYTVSDDNGGSVQATLTVTVTGQNDNPVAGANTFITNEDSSVTINVLSNDTDIDGGTLSVTHVAGTPIAVGQTVSVADGTVTLNVNGTLTFTPEADYNGPASFTYSISDGQGGTATAMVSGRVNAVADAPVAANDTITTPEDTPVTFDVRTNDVDADSDPLTVSAINGLPITTGETIGIAGGTVTLGADGRLTFTPRPNFNGSPSFTYTIDDGNGGKSTATVNLTVTPVADAPAAQDDSVTTNEDVPVTIPVLANDTDADGNTVTISAVDGTPVTATGQVISVDNGQVRVNANGTLTFTPATNYFGPAAFDYTVSDGTGRTDTATVRITVNPVNDAPVADDDTFLSAEETPVIFDVRGNDSDPEGNPLTVTQINGMNIANGGSIAVTGGTVSLGADGRLTFTPGLNYNGTPSFTYTISDGAGGTATATVTGTITPVNDTPVVGDDAFTTAEDTPVTFDVLGNDSDVDGDALRITAINGQSIGIGGSVTIAGQGVVSLDADGTLTFSPQPNFNGNVSFTYTVSDGIAPVTATVRGTVAPVNDAPVAADATVSTQEDSPITGVALPAATDVDGDTVVYSAGTTTTANGTVTINPNGTYTYTPNANFNGRDSFSYVVSDGNGGSNEYTVTITVIAQNDVPTARPIPTINETDSDIVNLDMSGYFADADGDTLSYTATGLPGGLTISGTGRITGTIYASASQGGPTADGRYSVTVTVADGNGGTTSRTFTMNVTNPPPIARDDAVTTNEDTPVTFNVITGADTTSGAGGVDSDPDGDALEVVSASAGNGTVIVNADGSLTYRPNANFNGTDRITYVISDGNGGTAQATVVVSVGAENDAPVGVAVPNSTRNDSDQVSFNASANFTDADGDTLTFGATGLPPGLSIDPATGVVSGTIDHSASGPTGIKDYIIAITARDGNGGVTTLTFTYTIVNVAPVVGSDTANAVEDTSVDIDVLANDTAPDGDSIDVIRVENIALTLGGPAVDVANGRVSLVAGPDGPVLRFVPTENYNGRTTFGYTVQDENGGISNATVTVNVAAVNDAPVVVNPISDRVRADGQALTYDVADFFRDPESQPIDYSASGLPAGLSITPAGVITGAIDHNASRGGPNGDGIYLITVTADDGNGGITQQTFSLTVTNPGPTAVNDDVTTGEDTPINIDVRANDIDPDGDALVFDPASPPSAGNGTVSINPDGTLRYVPNLDFNGTDTILYTIIDGDGGRSTASVTVTVTGGNDTPTSTAIPALQDSDTEVKTGANAVNVAPYFSDLDGDTLNFTATGLPPGLSIDPLTGIISGTITANASTGGPANDGVYTITVTAYDRPGANGLSVARSFDWVITNDPPVAVNDTAATDQDTVLTVPAAGVVDNDLDDDAIVVDEVNGIAVPVNGAVTAGGSNGGRFTVNADGSYAFDPNGDFDDLDAGETRVTSVVYRVDDGEGGTDTAMITITVTGVNDAPVVLDIPTYTRADNQSVTIDLAPFFSDVDAEPLNYTVSGLPAGLTFDPVTGRITGTIANDASVGGTSNNGVYTVTVTAYDGAGATGQSVAQTFELQVTNPAPTAGSDAVVSVEDTPINIDVLGNDTDPDGDALVVDPTFPPQAGNGTVTINPDGTLHYVPNANYTGVDTIIYRISDGQGGFSTGVVTVDVGATNDAPVAVDLPPLTRDDGQAVTIDLGAYFSDPEDTPITYTVDGLPPGLSVDATGRVTGTIAPGASGPTGTATYVVRVTAEDADGASTVRSFEFTAKNVAPQAADDSFTTTEDTPVNLDVLANDVDTDGDANVIIRVNNQILVLSGATVETANGTVQLVEIAGRQVIRFVPDANFNGVEAFTYEIDDGNGGTNIANVNVRVTAVNDAPVGEAMPDQQKNDRDPVNIDASAYFSDIDGDDLDFGITGLPAGLVYDPETGIVSGTLTRDASQGGPAGNGVYQITVTARDRDTGGLTASQTFSITVLNPTPTAQDDRVTVQEDGSVTFNPIAGGAVTGGSATIGTDGDPDGDGLSVTSIGGQAIAVGGSVVLPQGTVTRLANGALTFAPAPNFNGVVTIPYDITDTDGATASAFIVITVTAVNDPPIIDIDGTEDTGIDRTVSFTEGGAPVRIFAPDGGASDVENEVVALAITLGGFADGGNEVIHLNGSEDIVYGEFSSGTVTFGGTTFSYFYDGENEILISSADGNITAPAASALLRAIQYENRSDNPTDTAPRTMSFLAADAEGARSTVAVATINIAGVNDAPVAAADDNTTNEDVILNVGATGGVLANDSDPEGTALTVSAVGSVPGNIGTAVAGSNGGTFTIAADGSYRFNPGSSFQDLDGGETRTTSITYTVRDADGAVSTATLTITVTGDNDAPVGADGSITTTEDTPASRTLPVASDIDGEDLTYSAASQPAHGTVSVNSDGTYTYTPDANYNGPDSFTYSVTDGTETRTYTINVTVDPANDRPVAGSIDDRAFSDAAPVSFNIAGAFSDVDANDPGGEVLSYTATGLPAGLTLNAETGQITGTLARNASVTSGGSYTVTVTATDPDGQNISTDFVITVGNPAPIASNDAKTTTENTSTSGNVILDGPGRDTDPDGDALSVVSVNGSAVIPVGPATVAGSDGGTFIVRSDGSYTFNPGTDFDDLGNGESRDTTVTYRVSDGQGGFDTAVLRITVNGANDAPVAADASIATNEDSAVSGSLPTASDADGDPVSYAVAAGPTNGTVVINPDGTYTYTPDPDYSGPDTFTYTVSDGTTSITYTIDAAVAPRPDAPVAEDETFTVAEDGTVTIDVLAGDTDADAGATLRVSQIDGVNIAPVGVPMVVENGTVTLNGNGTLTFRPDPNYHGPAVFSYTVSDETGLTDTATVSGTVTSRPDAPVAQDDSYATDEDSSVSGNVIRDAAGQDTDIDGDRLAVVGVVTSGNPAGGAVGVGSDVGGSGGGIFRVRADGSFDFDPAGDFNDLDAGETRTTSIQYRASDGNGGFDTATLTVIVGGINDAPEAGALPPRSAEDGSTVSLALSPTFTDPEGGALAFTATGLPPGLTINPATGVVSGAIVASASGPTGSFDYSVTVTARDAGGAETSRTFVWTVTNPAPDARNDNVVVAEDGGAVNFNPITGAGTASGAAGVDSDPDGDPLVVSAVNGLAIPPGGRTIALDGGLLTVAANGAMSFEPNANFFGLVTFSYAVSDGNGGSDTATVSIDITSSNDRPVAGPDRFTLNEDGSADIAVLANDSDIEGDPLTITEINSQSVTPGDVVNVTGGTVRLNADGTLTFTPAANFTGSPSFQYTVSDGNGGSATATVNGTVNPVNDAPVNGLPPSYTGSEGTPLPLDGITVSDVDAGTGNITVTLQVDAGTLTASPSGTVTVGGSGGRTITLTGSLDEINAYLGATPPSYMPVPNSTAAVSLTMTTNDNGNTGAGGPLRDVDQVSIFLMPVNDNPTATPQTVSTNEDTPVTGQIDAKDVDGDTLTYRVATSPSNGTVVIDPDGSYHYTPAGNFSGTDTFSVQVDDGHGGTTSVLVTVTVEPVNDEPVASSPARTTPEDTPVSGAIFMSDVEGDVLTPTVETGPENGTVVLNPDGTYTYTPAANYNGRDQFTVLVTDANGGETRVTVQIDVTPVNDTPVASAPSVRTNEDTPVVGQITATDRDGDPLAYTVTQEPAHGTVTLRPDGSYTYTPASNYNGPDVFTVLVDDGHGGTTSALVMVTVDPVNDAPVASAEPVSTELGSPVSGAIVARDVDGDPLTFALDTSPSHGTLTLNPDGTYTYVPAPGFSGPDSFTVFVSDGQGGVTSVLVSITVQSPGDNETPVGPIDSEPRIEPAPIELELEGEVRSVTDSLNSIVGGGIVVGIVDDTANRLSPLNGISGLPSDGAVSAVVQQIGDWQGSDRRLGDMSVKPLLGGSSIERGTIGGSETFFIVDTVVKNDVLYVLASTAYDVRRGQATKHTITLGDGRALPAWMSLTKGGVAIGMPPIGLQVIDILIQAVDREGNVVEDRVRIDLMNGAISEHSAGRRADVGGDLFSRQAMMQFRPGADDSAALLAALRR